MIPDSQKRSEPTREDGSIYVVPQKERKIFHLEVEDKAFNSKTGKKQTKPYILKLDGVKQYKQYMDGTANTGVTVNMLHDPRPYFGMSKAEIKEMDKSYKK